MDFSPLFEAQREYFAHRVLDELKYRKQCLRRLKEWILANKPAIEKALQSDLNKGVVETATSEVKPVLTEIDTALANLGRWAHPKKVPAPLFMTGTKSEIRHHPRGVTLIMAPWNFPINLTVGPLVSALAAGCTAIIKPSEFTPATSALMEEMVKELYPPELVTVVQGEADVAGELLKLPFHHIYFTGSPAVGKIVMRAAAENLSSVTLELGGQNPLIIHETADVRDAAAKIVWSKVFNAGQSCVSPNTAYVPRKRKDEFLQEIAKAASKMLAKEKQGLSRIVNKKHFKRLLGLLNNATENGGKVAVGGDFDEQNRWISPTFIDLPAEDSPLVREEIFGPLLGVLPYDDFPKLLGQLRGEKRPLAAYLFTQSKRSEKLFTHSIIAGTSAVNDTTLQFIQPHLPFGGVNGSGIGKGHGHWGFLEFSNALSVLKQRRGFTISKTLYPPYTPLKQKLGNFFTRWL